MEDNHTPPCGSTANRPADIILFVNDQLDPIARQGGVMMLWL
jgi:hypothetical protein